MCAHPHVPQRDRFRAFWRVFFFVLINYTSWKRKRSRRKIYRKIWRFKKKVVPLPKNLEIWTK